MNTAPWGSLSKRLPRGYRILKYLDSFTTRVRFGAGKHARTGLVESLAPVLGEPARLAGSVTARRYALRRDVAEPPPGATPVNLDLTNTGAFFAPISSSTPVQIPYKGDGTINFPNQGLGVRVLGAGAAAGTLLNDQRLAYTSALDDTDLIVTPEDVGAELSWQARAADSPTDVHLVFHLPTGAALHESTEQPGEIDITAGSGVIASVLPVTAIDAAGNPVSASTTVNGDEVTVHVALNTPKVRFPVYVDPMIQDSYRIQTNGSGQGITPCTIQAGGDDSFDGWKWYATPSNNFGGWFDSGAPCGSYSNTADAGMAVYNTAGTFSNAAEGEFYYTAPANTYIDRADFGYMTFNPTNSSVNGDNICMYEGLYSFLDGRWETGNFNAYIGGSASAQTWGPNPMFDCATSSSEPEMPSGTFRAFCAGPNNVASYMANGDNYNGERDMSVYTNGAWRSPNPVAAQTPMYNASGAPPAPFSPAPCGTTNGGTPGNAAAFGLQFYGSGQLTGSAAAYLYGADIYLLDENYPTVDNEKLSPQPTASWIDSYQGSVVDQGTPPSGCNGTAPCVQQNGLGVAEEWVDLPTGFYSDLAYAPVAAHTPDGKTPPETGNCTGAPYHSPCPGAFNSATLAFTTSTWGEGPDLLQAYGTDPTGAWGDSPDPLYLNVDHQSPQTPAFQGPLYSARQVPGSGNPPPAPPSADQMTGLAYPLRITATDPGNASGPALVDVSVDNSPQDVTSTSCEPISQINNQIHSAYDSGTQCGQLSSGNRVATVNWTFQNTAYAAGWHTICVTVEDQVAQDQNESVPNCQTGGSTGCQQATSIPAHMSQSCFEVYTAPPATIPSTTKPLLSLLQNDELGLEKYFDYRQVPTGLGSTAAVNLATGNLVWNDIPVLNPGRGLSTFVEVTYNSQHRLGDLTLPALEYDQIGDGFSLGIDGLTRLNEPLDLSQASLPPGDGQIAFTDVDGTRHVFIKNATDSSGKTWIHPPGVFLWLRPWNGAVPGTSLVASWAITRPDGVTFFFDQNGYENAIEDRHHNVITFNSVATGLCAAGTPIPAGCSEQVTSVTDATGRTMNVTYNGSGTVSDITEHNSVDLHFGYDTAGNYLTSMTVANSSSSPHAFGFCYGGGTGSSIPSGQSCGGQDANPPVTSGSPLLSLLPGVTSLTLPPGLTQITDPNGNPTKISYAAPQTAIVSSSDPCPYDQTTAGLAQIGGLVGLVPKCVVGITDRGGGNTAFSYVTNSNDSRTTTITGPRDATNPSSSQTLYPSSGGSIAPNATGMAQEVEDTDPSGRPTEEIDPLGHVRTWSWTQPSQEPSTPSPQCASVQDLNSLQQLTQGGTLNYQTNQIDQSQATTTSYCYDQSGLLTDRWGPTLSGQAVSARHVSIQYYQSAGPATSTDNMQAPSGADASQAFVSDPVSLTDADGKTYQFQLDANDKADGLVTAVTDPTGAVWQTDYDTASGSSDYDTGHGLVTDQIDPLGNDTHTSYGSGSTENSGLPQSVTLPGASTATFYAYDNDGNVLAETDPRGAQSVPATSGTKQPYTSYLTYDALNQLTQESIPRDSQHGVWTTRSYVYDTNENLKSETDANNNQFSYTYTPMDQLASQSTPPIAQAGGATGAAEVTSYCYDMAGDMTDEVLPAGQATATACQNGIAPTNGQPSGVTHAYHWLYDLDGEQLVQNQLASDVPSRVTSYAYNSRGDQVGVADAADNSPNDPAAASSSGTDYWLNAQAATSGAGGPSAPWRTETVYDSADEPIAVVQNPEATQQTAPVYTSRTEYDADGNVIGVEGANNPATPTQNTATGEFELAGVPGMTTYSYDARDLLSSITDALGNTTQYVRRTDGKICAVIAPRGTAANTNADCTSGGSANPWKTLYSYYPEGWLQQITLPRATNEYSYGSQPMSVTYTRNAAGYPTTITDPRGTTITNSFYDDGELESTTAPWWWTYDPQGTSTAGPDPNTGGRGQLASDTPGAGLQVREKTLQELYQDAQTRNQFELPSDPPGQTRSGAVAAQSLPGILPQAGQTKTNFSYDGNGWLTGVSDALASNTTPDYDGTTTLTLDQLGELLELDQPYDGNNDLSKTYYAYDADGNQTKVDTPQTTAAQSASDTTDATLSSYNGLDQLASTIAPGAATSSASSGPPYPGRTTTYTYTLDPLSDQATVPGDLPGGASTFTVASEVAVTSPSPNTSQSTTVTTQHYYDALGNELATVDPLGNITGYAYDQQGDQVQTARPNGNKAGYQLTETPADTTTRTFNLDRELTSSTDGSGNKTQYSYDPDGNVSQIAAPGAQESGTGGLQSEVTTYDYNGRDLPWKTTTGTGTDARTTVTEYDPDGNLIRTVGPAAVTAISGGNEATANPINQYPDASTGANNGKYYGATDTTEASSYPAANLDATINVYDSNNMLQSVYLPWGCTLTTQAQNPSCVPTSGNGQDTRRFKEDFGRNDPLDRLTSIRQAYDWTNSSPSNATTTYGYLPNGWASSESDPATAEGPGISVGYTYDAAGDQTGATTIPSSGTSAARLSERSYYPSGQLQMAGATSPAYGGYPALAHAFNYYYEPSGQLAQIKTSANTDGSPNENEQVCYDLDGRQTRVNTALNGTSSGSQFGPGLDTAQTYDADGNVTTREDDGQLTATTCPTSTQTSSPQSQYTQGETSEFSYTNLDQQTGETVVSNTGNPSPQPSRSFATTYWPSGQPEMQARIQGAVGQAPPSISTPSLACPAQGTPTGGLIQDCRYYNDNGSLAEDDRLSASSTDDQDQTYAYDIDGNRTTDERGTHLFNAMDQEVLWTRGGGQGSDTAMPGSTVSYYDDGTGAVLQTVSNNTQTDPSTGDQVNTQTTTDHCSQATAHAAQSNISTCQLDDDRIENTTSTAAIKINGVTQPAQSAVTYLYCYDPFGELARVTQFSSCPTNPSQTTYQSANGNTESPGTTTIYSYNLAGQQKQAVAPDPNSSSNSPTISNENYQYDALGRIYAKNVQFASTTNAQAGSWSTPLQSSYGYVGLSSGISSEQESDAASTTQYPETYDYDSSGNRVGVYRAADPGATNATLQSAAYHTYAVDANGSISTLENSDGSVTIGDHYHYTPYGDLDEGASEGGNNVNSNTSEQALAPDAEANNYRFEGFYDDTPVSTYQLPARNYLTGAGSEANTGYFTTADRFEAALGDQALQADPLTQNRYAFAGGNPTGNVEYDGHRTESSCGAGCEVYTAPWDDLVNNNGTTTEQMPNGSGGTTTRTTYPTGGTSTIETGPSGSATANAALLAAAQSRSIAQAVVQADYAALAANTAFFRTTTGANVATHIAAAVGKASCGNGDMLPPYACSSSQLASNEVTVYNALLGGQNLGQLQLPQTLGLGAQPDPVGSAVIGALAGGLGGVVAKALIGTLTDLLTGAGLETTEEILNGHVAAAVDRFETEGLTQRQALRAAENPNLTPAFRGERIDTFAKESAATDPRLAGLNITGRFQPGPDFLDPEAGGWWDITTPGQWEAHVARYGPGGTRLPY